MATVLRILFSLSFVLLCVSNEIPPTNLTRGFVRFPDAIRQITWYTLPGGMVVYDGDFVFGTTELLNNAVVNITSSSDPAPSPRSYPPPHKRAFSAFPGSSTLWPGGTVYYRFFDSITESAFSTVVKDAINTWTSAVPCLKFVQLANDNNPAGAAGVLTIRAGNFGHCFTTWGYENTPRWMLLESTGTICKQPPVLLRLLGAVLTLKQEHRRPDRDAFITVRCENVFGLPASCAANPDLCCSSSCQGLGCWFTTESGFYYDTSPYSPNFDLSSIMLKTRHFLARSSTLVTLDGAPSVMATTLSALDILRVKELYGCAPGQVPPTGSCNPGCNPTMNQCHVPTAQTCIFPANVPNARAACACRAGFKATTGTILDGDTTKQWRLPASEGNFRVWVAEGVPCDTLCAVSTGALSCQEVKELPATCLRN